MNRFRLLASLTFSLAAMLFQTEVQAVNPAVWNMMESTNGGNVFWTSSTAVDSGFPRYHSLFEINRVEVFTFLGGTDVTDQLGDTAASTITDSLPITLLNESLTEPSTGTSATINVGVDASGFGQLAITDVTLGTFLFIPITQIDFDANLTFQGIVPGDFDVNLEVDSLDFSRWETFFGLDNSADTDFDGDSDGKDFLDWQRYYGSEYSTPPPISVTVPEPASIASFMLGMLLMLKTSSARRR